MIGESIPVPEFVRHIWLVFLFINAVNAAWIRFRPHPDGQSPEAAAADKTISQGLLFWGSLPWLVMGAGLESGRVGRIDDFFRPREGNPYVQAFLITIVVIWIALLWWVYFRDGAELLAARRVMPLQHYSVNQIKLWVALSVAGGVVALFLMLFTDFAKLVS